MKTAAAVEYKTTAAKQRTMQPNIQRWSIMTIKNKKTNKYLPTNNHEKSTIKSSFLQRVVMLFL